MMIIRSIKRASLLLMAVFAPLGLVGCPTGVGDPATAPIDPNAIVIGLLRPEPSGFFAEGEVAARLAVQEINAAGGVNGRPLALQVLYDGVGDASVGVRSAQQMVDNGVVAIIGAVFSSVTIPVAEQVTIPANIALISPGSTSPLITSLADNDTVYRIPPSDALQGRLLAERVWAEGHTSAALFIRDDAYGQGLAVAFKLRYLELGGSIHAEAVAPASKQSGFSAEINTLYASGTPPVLMLFSFAEAGIGLVRDILLVKGSLPRLYAVDAIMTPETFNNAPVQMAGMRGVSSGTTIDSPEFQYFAEAFTRATGTAPSSGETYDAVYLVALAMAQGGSNDRASVLANLRAVSRPDGPDPVAVGPGEFARAVAAIASGADIDYQGVSSAIDFDVVGDPFAASYIYQEVRFGPNGLELVTLGSYSYP